MSGQRQSEEDVRPAVQPRDALWDPIAPNPAHGPIVAACNVSAAGSDKPAGTGTMEDGISLEECGFDLTN
jgi:hypothetical protein